MLISNSKTHSFIHLVPYPGLGIGPEFIICLHLYLFLGIATAAVVHQSLDLNHCFLFVALVTDWMLDRDPQEEVFKAFRLFDDDDSGKISLRNLRRVARELGENMTDEELRAMIDEFDKDGDGESEFLC